MNLAENGTLHNGKYGDYVVVQYISPTNVTVMFVETGCILEKRTKQSVLMGNIKDTYIPSVQGVGYMGNGKYKSWSNNKPTKPYKTWVNMMERCYSEKYHNRYPTYRGCTVCSEWHNFQNFAKWFDEKYIDGYELDKDTKVDGNNIYSPQTCVFISHKDNVTHTHRHKMYKVKVVAPDNKIIEVSNQSEFCREHGLCKSNFNAVINGKRIFHRGYKLYINPKYDVEESCSQNK